jgi:anti-sigma factor RsiW
MSNTRDRNSEPGCIRFATAADAYIDGELDPGHQSDVDAHLVECDECAERLAAARALRTSLKNASSRRASEALRERVCAAMARERTLQLEGDADEAVAAQPVHGGSSMLRLRYAVALAAAAGIAFAMGLSRMTQAPVGDLAPKPRQTTASTTKSFDSLLDELVELHSDPLPPETRNPDELPRFDPLVGVPVRRPAMPARFDATFDGARVHAMRDRRRAALLQYTVQNKQHSKHRVTVYVFDPAKVPVKDSCLTPRQGRDRAMPVYVGTMRGYSVAAAERSGVGYAFATDLDGDESAQLAMAVQQ